MCARKLSSKRKEIAEREKQEDSRTGTLAHRHIHMQTRAGIRRRGAEINAVMPMIDDEQQQKGHNYTVVSQTHTH